jgi:hypothetical protein
MYPPVGLANTRISTDYAQKSPRSLIHMSSKNYEGSVCGLDFEVAIHLVLIACFFLPGRSGLATNSDHLRHI